MPDKPKVEESLVRRIWWSMVSKAAERSSKTRADTFFSLEARSRSFWMRSKAVSVELNLHLKPTEKDRVRGSLEGGYLF